MNTLFYITPQFPPNRDVGARRALNIARHINRYDWKPVVFTTSVRNSGYDAALETLIPDDLDLYREFDRPAQDISRQSGSKKQVEDYLPAFLSRHIAEKGPYYIPFDQHKAHLRHALGAAKKLISHHRPDLILVNADPWSGLLLGHRLSRWSGIPWLADLRDPWSLHTYKMQLRPALIRYIIRRYERIFFQSASRVVLNTRLCCEAYREYYAGVIDTNRLVWIRNAFDRDNYLLAPPANRPDKFSLHYFGTFRIYMDPGPLFELLGRYVKTRNLSPEKIELVLYGDQRQRDMDLAARLGLMPYIRTVPAVSLTDTIKVLASASVLVLVEGPGRKLQLPAKLYDYLAVRRPILALSENTELNSILQSTASGLVADYNNVDDGLAKLDQLYRAAWHPQFIDEEMEKYSVRHQVQQFAGLFNEVLRSG